MLPILGRLGDNPQALGYLTQRNITQATAATLGLADWVEARRIFIPFGGENGDVIGYTGRDYTGTAALKYRNNRGPKVLYVPERTAGAGTKADTRPIVVVEGPLDAIAIHQAGGGRCQVVAIGGKTCSSAASADLRRLCRDRSVRIWLDPDAQTESVALLQELAPHVADVRRIWHETCKDAGETPPDELARFLLHATV